MDATLHHPGASTERNPDADHTPFGVHPRRLDAVDNVAVKSPDPVPPSPAPRALDWRVYADATCAGLTPLIPLPFLDLAAEAVFRRRIPGAVAQARGVELAPGATRLLSRGHEQWLSLDGCLKIPLFVFKYVAKKLWRKVIYVFAIADAVEQTSLYWHRAFLTDHIIRGGHASAGADLDRTGRVALETLRRSDTGALKTLAKTLIRQSGRILRTLRRSRRQGAEAHTTEFEAFFREHWTTIQRSLFSVAVLYNDLYEASLAPPPRPPTPPTPE
jgi:hypothetical protein